MRAISIWFGAGYRAARPDASLWHARLTRARIPATSDILLKEATDWPI
ncbi:MAG: hypothetical protein OXC60_20725 [Litoreibacter sp.]|nr:hypothetical protein [Litoreibacter sp.]